MSDSDDLLAKKHWFSTKDKKMVYGAGVALALVAMLFVIMKLANPQKTLKEEPKLKPLSMSSDILGADEFQKFSEAQKVQNEMIKENQTSAELMRIELESLKKQLEDMKKSGAQGQPAEKQPPQKAGKFNSELEKFNKKANDLTKEGDGQLSNFQYPESPTVKQIHAPTQPRSAGRKGGGQNQQNSEQLVGGVGFVTGTPEPAEPAKKQRRYYLPPSFMTAKLLTGVDALTSKQGKDNEEQVFFLVDAPAILPNQIKKDLSGCFVVANVHGNLAKERAQIQAVNLSCLSGDGNAVIDEKILGFATDDGDGKRDLAGNVVSRDGTKMAWLMAASVVSELGKSASYSSFDQNQNLLGTTSTLNKDKVLQQSSGAAVQSAGEAYKDVILDYIKQSGPVIEMGPMKKATIFVQKGVWLNIKDRSSDDA